MKIFVKHAPTLQIPSRLLNSGRRETADVTAWDEPRRCKLHRLGSSECESNFRCHNVWFGAQNLRRTSSASKVGRLCAFGPRHSWNKEVQSGRTTRGEAHMLSGPRLRRDCREWTQKQR